MKEQLKRQNAATTSETDTSGYARSSHYSVRMSSTTVTTKASSSSSSTAGGGGYDMKAVQKEAVLSYYKAKAATKQSSAGEQHQQQAEKDVSAVRRSVSPRTAPPSTRLQPPRVTAAAASSIPQPGTKPAASSAYANNRLMSQHYHQRLANNTNAVKQPEQQQQPQPQPQQQLQQTGNNSTADAHIAQLKTVSGIHFSGKGIKVVTS